MTPSLTLGPWLGCQNMYDRTPPMARALVVDDSRAIRLILTQALAGCGFEVSQAANGLEAMQVMEREASRCRWY
jgi:PleD family two-component response regulator